MNTDLYDIFIRKYLEEFKDDEGALYNFRCINSNLKCSIKNYEFWASLKEEENITETLSCFSQMLTAYYKLKRMGCEVPKLTKLCKNTTYIRTLINS